MQGTSSQKLIIFDKKPVRRSCICWLNCGQCYCDKDEPKQLNLFK